MKFADNQATVARSPPNKVYKTQRNKMVDLAILP